ncbi:Rrf2 family transcriptional regulator [Jiella sp. MQZ9-1]|uniref:Rrf2 family transcriptional regulator n=1 Tax=Jiella flava TaxID=2816857 RepID=A0A939FYP7_9HYPH|nr:Rrf2 family transcriptional regulator [Jiella flava]MBO0662443.1 Rrf2 family transcriptional regulator [Jiella flava]MCD2471667.1 Rrf2 family transcriptional regulator [Jiella flava]
MLTMKGKYGLKAMLYLAGTPSGSFALSEEIATANHISKKFLDTILGDLRTAGFVHSRKGRNGGYTLARDAAQIRVGHILRVLDGPLAPIPCASRTAYRRCNDCQDEESCSVRLVMLEVRNAISAILDEKTLSELRSMPQLVDQTAEQLAING